MTLRFRPAAARVFALGALAGVLHACGPSPTPTRAPPEVIAETTPGRPPQPTISSDAAVIIGAETCDTGLSDAARRNDESLRRLTFAPFRRPETGWEVYEPLMAHEIGTRCGGGSAAFASDLAAWQSAHGLEADGVVSAATFAALKAVWEARRPFVAANHAGCPAPPPEASLAVVPAVQSYGGKILRLRPRALAAYEQMLASARAAAPELRADPRLMTVFSAYRSPEYDAARCARDGNCQGVTRASCSPHRTGLAMDIYLGAEPGYGPDSSDDANRLFITHGGAYRWMVENAGRFGFAPYAFEPWHWEWIGEPI